MNYRISVEEGVQNSWHGQWEGWLKVCQTDSVGNIRWSPWDLKQVEYSVRWRVKCEGGCEGGCGQWGNNIVIIYWYTYCILGPVLRTCIISCNLYPACEEGAVIDITKGKLKFREF